MLYYYYLVSLQASQKIPNRFGIFPNDFSIYNSSNFHIFAFFSYLMPIMRKNSI